MSKAIFTWKDYETISTEPKEHIIGNLKISFMYSKNELLANYEYFHSRKDNIISKKISHEKIAWSRWAVKKEITKLQLKPQMPDRPVIIKPDSPFRIVKNSQAQIYVHIPVWIQLGIAGRHAYPLLDIPTIILSNTWFGSFLEGELCYWVSSGVRRQIELGPDRPYMAICPIFLSNKSDQDLLVEKLALRVTNLSLYQDKEQLWAGDTSILYKGEQDSSQIDFPQGPPVDAKSAKLINTARVPSKKGLSIKTFSTLKDLPGMGIFTN
ncbi:MAG: DUF432 domain-containing protein [Calditrichaceae bacterium]